MGIDASLEDVSDRMIAAGLEELGLTDRSPKQVVAAIYRAMFLLSPYAISGESAWRKMSKNPKEVAITENMITAAEEVIMSWIDPLANGSAGLSREAALEAVSRILEAQN